ncbi:MAG: Coq4 family protein [Ilumatobacter sp.]|uniref:Coq4 family protein n=1 Tax=Ilumatobacter sp. TaxID=1967498 RepID=UPI0026136309|nr:Coq4 family protein [Ilumatobacter sp.]MDJ0767340.1 Coq4 family protein [Ilumatobacter sp.]
MTTTPIDREFAEKFMKSVDEPFKYGVYWLFHEWWDEAPDPAIDAYRAELGLIEGSDSFLAERFLPEPTTLDRLAECPPESLGAYFRQFVVENNLEADLARNYREYNEELTQSGKLDRLPDDLSYMMLRGFQIHDILHVLTGYTSRPMGELGLAAFYLAQLRFPYHAMRMAVTAAHVAFVSPAGITKAMDAIAEGWLYGRRTPNLSFHRWEDELDAPLHELRERFGIETEAMAV